jgi:hypothetical protein
MVRRGRCSSPSEGSAKSLLPGIFRSAELALRRRRGGYGAVYGAFKLWSPAYHALTMRSCKLLVEHSRDRGRRRRGDAVVAEDGQAGGDVFEVLGLKAQVDVVRLPCVGAVCSALTGLAETRMRGELDPAAATRSPGCDCCGHDCSLRSRRGAWCDRLGHDRGLCHWVADDANSSYACRSQGHRHSPSVADASSASMEAMIA